MTKSKKRLDSNPDQTIIDFDTPLAAYSRMREELLLTPAQIYQVETYEEACIELAAAIKRTIRDFGKSRDIIVDAINAYFGWDTRDKRKCLTLTTFNNYLSKPVQYPIPAIYIVAIQHICHSLEPTRYFADLEGGKVITGDEVRKLALGKLDDAMSEMRRLKKEFRGGKRP
ncbi:MAG: hypothetical protein ABFD76_03345 [Smithella sp.]